MATRIKKENTREVSITGFVEEIELEDGEMGLQVDDGEDVYLVVMDKIGSKLEDHIDEEVDVSGLVTNTADDLVLKVKKFRPTDDYYYEDDDAGYDDGYDAYYDEDDN